MTWFLAIIGLAFTWYNLIPDYQYMDEYSLEYEINYQEYQKELITEWFFEFAEALGKYHYTRWCAGGYEPSSWSEEKQKRLKCSTKSFDTWWVDWLDKVYKTNSENPLWFYIVLDWYAYDSEANRIINRWYIRNNDLDMIATYVCENQWFDPTVVSDTNDRWLCQLNYRYNKIFINDPNRLDINFQKQVCLDKWNLVKDKNLWSCYSKREIYLDKIKNVDDWYRSVGDH